MDTTNDPTLRSFLHVGSASDFPVQNLPWGVFRPAADATPRVGTALGDWVVDLGVLEERGFFDGPLLRGQVVFQQAGLNAFMALGTAAWQEARQTVSRLLRADVATLRDDAALREEVILPRDTVQMLLPCEIGGFTDFYASIHHATTVGRIFRGDDAALTPNYRHMPIAYNGRASSVVVSGTDVRRPVGQTRPSGAESPSYGPSRELDFELELGVLIGPGNALGEAIPIRDARRHVFGFVLLNDWSARDIQRWEYQPLGPFLGKSFCTTISPWVVSAAALEPFRCTPPVQDPRPLPYLERATDSAYDIQLEAAVQAAEMDEPGVVCRTDFREMYWTVDQLIAHHTVGGCDLRPGDLLGSGTVSGDQDGARGCLLEATWGGQRQVALGGGVERQYLEDGDRVVLRGWCEGVGYRVGFGECFGAVRGARCG